MERPQYGKERILGRKGSQEEAARKGKRTDFASVGSTLIALSSLGLTAYTSQLQRADAKQAADDLRWAEESNKEIQLLSDLSVRWRRVYDVAESPGLDIGADAPEQIRLKTSKLVQYLDALNNGLDEWTAGAGLLIKDREVASDAVAARRKVASISEAADMAIRFAELNDGRLVYDWRTIELKNRKELRDISDRLDSAIRNAVAVARQPHRPPLK